MFLDVGRYFDCTCCRGALITKAEMSLFKNTKLLPSVFVGKAVPENASIPMVCKLSGKLTLFKFAEYAKALLLMWVIPSGKLTLFKLLQL